MMNIDLNTNNKCSHWLKIEAFLTTELISSFTNMPHSSKSISPCYEWQNECIARQIGGEINEEAHNYIRHHYNSY